MAEASWRLFYESDLQAFWSLIFVPAAFVAYLLGSARARKAAASTDARFLYAYCLAFGIATIVDPLCTGPMLEWLDLGTGATPAVMIAFVLLGDFRVFLLVFFLTRPDRRLGRAAAEAALWTLGVPVFAVGANAAVPARARDSTARGREPTGAVTTPAARPRLRGRLLRPVGDGGRTHPVRRNRRGLAPARASQSALLRVLDPVRLRDPRSPPAWTHGGALTGVAPVQEPEAATPPQVQGGAPRVASRR
jgi:hypothetical protein